MSYEDFYDEGEIKLRDEYFNEISLLVGQMTGASHVHCFGVRVRNSDSKGVKGVDRVMGPAMGAHNDLSSKGAENLFYGCSGAKPELRKGKYMLINAWRNISHMPI
jgi:hypothetical protein